MASLPITDTLEIPEEQLQWSFARSSGPGGQNVNKVNSKATLRWIREPGTLSQAAWGRFRRNAKRYMTTEGEVVIQSQEHREQAQNVEACRQKLRSLIQLSLKPPKRRIATKPTKASRQRRLDNKRRRSDKKKSRQAKDF
ncbi:MAG: aminoacyl-tRNA hydrolase [Planctomycetales bacterium]|nr:aminoacyl-tRNA hydrolase [Planctomycetales bacterium]